MINVEGVDFDQVNRDLARLSKEIQDKAIRSGLTRAAGPIKKSMASNAPQKSGDLSQSINQKLVTKGQASRLSPEVRGQLISSTSGVAIIVGPNKKVNNKSQVYKAIFAESGTASHVIKPKTTGGFLRFFGGVGSLFSKKIDHPGAKANPFMQKALTQNESQLQTRFYQGLAARLDKLS